MRQLFWALVLVSLIWIPAAGNAHNAAAPFMVLQTDTAASPAATNPPANDVEVPLPATGEKKADQPETYDVNYSYDPGGRRDPFVSLLAGIKTGKSKIPAGALTVQDAKLVGITRNKDGYVAIIVGADNKARFMKAGDNLYDGQILSIEADRVTFRQDLKEDNPAAPGLKSKEVVKKLYPEREGT
ncbi:MAG TPA: hypothetical protein VFG11_00190 [Acidobacteriota bacterium]|nr:hypothetical protein [Acidobacteriota bacterium]